MESWITFFIFIAVLIVCCYAVRKAGDSNTTSSTDNNNKTSDTDYSSLHLNSTIEVNGVHIHLTDKELKKIEESKHQKEKEKFNEDKEELLNEIKRDLSSCDDIIKRKVLEELLKHPLETRKDYDRLKYVYNYGDLRSNEDVKQYDHYINTKEQRENFDKERHKRNILIPLLSFVIVFIIVLAACNSDMFIGIPLGIFFGLLAAYIVMMIGYKVNINNAKEYCIPDNDPRVVDEKRKRAVGIASGIAAGVSIGRHAKSNTKELLNPDSWKEMK